MLRFKGTLGRQFWAKNGQKSWQKLGQKIRAKN
jgi:hypothetical protein